MLAACLARSPLLAAPATLALPPPPAPSLYELLSPWQDQAGKLFHWQDLQGRPALIAMVYTSCQQSCPMIVSELNSLVKSLSKERQAELQVLLFSFDPERDTVERLASYAKERRIKSHWRLLTATGKDVRELAAVLGFRFKKMQSGDFSHANTITLLNRSGQIQGQQTDLKNGRERLVEQLQQM